MDAVIEIVEGDKPEDATTCAFCGKTTNVSQFGLILNKRYNGYVLKFMGICEDHLAKIEALLTGETDINKIYCEKTTKSTPFLRLRGRL